MPAGGDHALGLHDVLAPTDTGSPDAGAARLVDRAEDLARGLLRPAAEATDRAPIVPASHLDALATAGLQGIMGPVEFGGHAAGARVNRQIFEVLAGACGVTFFVWVQHHAPVRLLARSDNAGLREKWLSRLCRGEVLGGVAFAYLRRPGPPAVVARPVGGGYRVDGEAPWVTSWGLAGFYSVAAAVVPTDGRESPGQAVYFCLTDTARDEVRPSEPLALAAMNASSTVRVEFRDLFVPTDDVIALIDLEEWRRRDSIATAQPNPAAFGIASTCLEDVDNAALADELQQCRTESYRLADVEGDERHSPEHLDRLIAARAWSLELAVRSATARVAATGGRAMERSNPGQRLLREAAFFTIQAQTRPLREATLQRLGRRDAGRRRVAEEP
ncbi:MAG: acyl-CoA/acyl-ACP dehydrogenase [Actinomycetota bacterium]|nr:acyl-CoA/acyl-ACP dehydrogenase [Actinomycetota bacterium]